MLSLSRWTGLVGVGRAAVILVAGGAAAALSVLWWRGDRGEGLALARYVECGQRLGKGELPPGLLEAVRSDPEVAKVVERERQSLRQLLDALCCTAANELAVWEPLEGVDLPPVDTLGALDGLETVTVRYRRLECDEVVARVKGELGILWQTSVRLAPAADDRLRLLVRIENGGDDAGLGLAALRDAGFEVPENPAPPDCAAIELPLSSAHLTVRREPAAWLSVLLGQPSVQRPREVVPDASWQRVRDLPFAEVSAGLAASSRPAAWLAFAGLAAPAVHLLLLLGLRRRVLATRDRLPTDFALRRAGTTGPVVALILLAAMLVLTPQVDVAVRVAGGVVAVVLAFATHRAGRALRAAVGARTFGSEGFSLPARGAGAHLVGLWLASLLLLGCASSSDLARLQKEVDGLAERLAHVSGSDEKAAFTMPDVEKRAQGIESRLAELEKRVADLATETSRASDVASVRNQVVALEGTFSLPLYRRLVAALAGVLMAPLRAFGQWSAFPDDWSGVGTVLGDLEAVEFETAEDASSPVWRRGLILPLEITGTDVVCHACTRLVRARRAGIMRGPVRVTFEDSAAVHAGDLAIGQAKLSLNCTVKLLGGGEAVGLRIDLGVDAGGRQVDASVSTIASGALRQLVRGKLRGAD